MANQPGVIAGRTTRPLVFQPNRAHTTNTWGASIPSGFPVRATPGTDGGWALRASLDFDDDYELSNATAEDFTKEDDDV